MPLWDNKEDPTGTIIVEYLSTTSQSLTSLQHFNWRDLCHEWCRSLKLEWNPVEFKVVLTSTMEKL